MLKKSKGKLCTVRATAYMEGQDHLRAGHALRQARSDRRHKPGYRQPRDQANGNRNSISNTHEHNAAATKDNAQALSGVDANAAIIINATNGASNKVSNLDQENVKPEGELQGNQVDSSARKPKKKGFWQHRRQKARKSNDAAAAIHKTVEGVSVVDVPNDSNNAADAPDQENSVQKQETQQTATDGQGISNGHASIQETVDNEPNDDKPDTATKENGITSNNPSDEVSNEKSEVKKSVPTAEVMATEPKAEPDQDGVTVSG
jgi:hypothetical protein